jgi:mycobactin polyketide synthetase MbtD
MRAVHLWAAATPPAHDPASAPTIAIEDWQQAAPTTVSDRPQGIAIAGDVTGALAQRLTDAVAAHANCDLVSADEADIVAAIAPAIDQLDVTAALEQIVGRPRTGLPDYSAVIGPRCRAVWLLTVGGERVHSDDAEVRPAQAALAAMHRSVGLEFPDHAFGNLDLPSRQIDQQTAAAAVEVLIGEPAVTALRANARRYVRSFRECRKSLSAGVLDTATFENVVITGGNGAIGLRYAQHCLKRGAQKVILLSRTGLDPSVLDRLAERRNVEVHAPQCDITDPVAVSRVAAEYGGSGASLLIHAAGIAKNHGHAELTSADLAAVCAAKVTGLVLLTDAWPLRADCRILACSSVFGMWGGHGHAAYAASNRLLDILAAQLRAKGLDCRAIRWGLWQDAGVVDAGELARTQRSGLIAMEAEAALDAGLAWYAEDPLIFAADFDRLRVLLGAPTPAGNGFAGKSLTDVVRNELATTLHLGDSLSIDSDASLIDLGLDSLLALDLRRRLRRAVGHSAPVAQMLGGITVSELIDAIGKAGSHA